PSDPQPHPGLTPAQEPAPAGPARTLTRRIARSKVPVPRGSRAAPAPAARPATEPISLPVRGQSESDPPGPEPDPPDPEPDPPDPEPDPPDPEPDPPDHEPDPPFPGPPPYRPHSPLNRAAPPPQAV